MKAAAEAEEKTAGPERPEQRENYPKGMLENYIIANLSRLFHKNQRDNDEFDKQFAN